VARRRTEVFGLSFMDCICCGFGATILLFTILNAKQTERAHVETGALLAEVLQREKVVKDAQLRRVELRNALKKIDEENVTTQGLSRRLIEVMQQLEEELAARQDRTLAQKEHVEKLKADLKSLEEANKRLSGGIKTDDVPGERTRSFVGDGERQYLTGLRVGGRRILFLVDASASMLADTVVNAVRRRNLSEATRRKADKWVHASRSVDWLTSQVPRDAKFQVYLFDTKARAAIAGTEGVWLEAKEAGKLDQAVAAVKSTAPSGGTSLHHAFAVVRSMNPLPDNVILITDGLPTQGRTPPTRRGTVSARERERFFEQALRELPRGVTVNTVLFPMEGDPEAAAGFWKLAMATHGSFMTPSRDWP
jgi:hypothetical protein